MIQREPSADLVRALKYLKLGKLLPVLPERLRQARVLRGTPNDVLSPYPLRVPWRRCG